MTGNLNQLPHTFSFGFLSVDHIFGKFSKPRQTHSPNLTPELIFAEISNALIK